MLHLKRFNKTVSPIFVLLCVLFFPKATFRIFICKRGPYLVYRDALAGLGLCCLLFSSITYSTLLTNVLLFQCLLDNGADLFCRNDLEKAAIHMAAQGGHVKYVLQLTLAISNSLISNNRLSRSENLPKYENLTTCKNIVEKRRNCS